MGAALCGDVRAIQAWLNAATALSERLFLPDGKRSSIAGISPSVAGRSGGRDESEFGQR